MRNAKLAPGTGHATDINHSLAIGRLLAFLTAAFFGGSTTFARLAYQGGTNPITVVAARFLLGTLVVALVIVALRRSFRIPRRTWRRTMIVTFFWFLVATGYVSSVFFIPVSLAVLIFYTFPLIVAATSRFVEGERLGGVRALAFLIAFAGLALALGPSIDELDWRGVALAAVGAVASAMTLILSRPLLVEQGVFTFNLYVNAGSAVLIVGVILLVGGIAWPHDASGWTGLGGATLFFAVAVLVLFGAIRYAGPAHTAMILNLEPLLSIGAAALLLGERLIALQLVGALLVVAALILSTRKGAYG